MSSSVTPSVTPAQTRCLLALLRRQTLYGSASVGAVADEMGVAKSTAYAHLLRLRRAGLVGFESGKAGTLRALVEVVGAMPNPQVSPYESNPCSGRMRGAPGTAPTAPELAESSNEGPTQ